MRRLTLFALAGFAGVFVAPTLAQTSNEPTETAAQPHATSADVAAPVAISGGATLASQYRFRGISLSDEEVAIQGAINLDHESGFYAGVWASSLDGFGELGGSNVEVDLYGGYKTEVASGMTVDAGLLYYAYPGSSGGDFEFFEPYMKVSGAIGPASATVGAAYAWEQDALGGNDNLYLFNDNSLPIKATPITLVSHVGYSSGASALAAGDDYVDWSFGAAAAWRNLTLGVSYVDTNIDRTQALSVGAAKDVVDSAIVASLTASF